MEEVVVDNIRSAQRTSKLQHLLGRLMLHNIDRSHFEGLYDQLKKLDSDQTGRIDRDSFIILLEQNGVNSTEIVKCFNNLDRKNRESVSFESVLGLVAYQFVLQQDHRILNQEDHIFRFENDGMIDIREVFREVGRSTSSPWGNLDSSIQSDTFVTRTSSASSRLSRRDFRKMFFAEKVAVQNKRGRPRNRSRKTNTRVRRKSARKL